MIPVAAIPVYDINDLRKYVQLCARDQWSNLKPDRMVCVGMKSFPTALGQDLSVRAKAIIDWFTDLRGLFDLDLPLTFIISIHGKALILISGGTSTYTDS